MTISSFLDVVKMRTGSPESRCFTLFFNPKKTKGAEGLFLVFIAKVFA